MTTQQMMSDIEAIVFQWLTERGINFRFQSSLGGGHFELGGTVVDFLLVDRSLAWRVHGEYWHRGVSVEGKDFIQKELLAGLGWLVVDIWAGSLRDPDRVNETLTKALLGQEVLR